MRQVNAMMLTRSMRKSARAEYQDICQTDRARAAVRGCCPRGICCKGLVPWAHDRSIASAPRGDMKSLDLNEVIDIIWFSHDFSKSARAGHLSNCCCKSIEFLRCFCGSACKHSVFDMILTCARVMTLLYVLQGTRALGA